MDTYISYTDKEQLHYCDLYRYVSEIVPKSLCVVHNFGLLHFLSTQPDNV